MKMEDSEKYVKRLEKRNAFLEENNRFIIDALDKAVTLTDFPHEADGFSSPVELLFEIARRTRNIIPFKTVAFYLISEEDSDLTLALCDPHSRTDVVEREMNHLLETRMIEWILNRRKPVSFAAAHTEGELLLHTMSTSVRMRGLFIGILDTPFKDISDIPLGLLSVLMTSGAGAIESFELYRWIKNINRDLQNKIQKLSDTEASVRKSEQRLNRAQHVARVGSFDIDISTNTMHWSNEQYRLLGLDPDKDTPSADLFADMIHEDDRTIFNDMLKNAGMYGRSYDCEIRYIPRDGRCCTAHVQIEQQSDASGRPLSVYGTFQDITMLRKAQQEIQEGKENLENIFNTTGDGIVVTDGTGIVRRCNRTLENMLGYDADEMVGRHIAEIVSDDPGLHKRMQAALERLQEVDIVKNIKAEWRCKNGDTCPVEYNMTVFRDSAGNLTGSVGSVRDVTELRRMEQEKEQIENQLRQAQKMEAIGTLAGGIAHDFNNILTIITGYTDLLLEKHKSDDRTHRILHEIFSATQRGTNLVHQILTFSRKKKLEHKPLKLDSIVKETIKFLQTSLPKSIALKAHIETDHCVILSDPTQAQQVLINLCTNAAHAIGDRDGTVTVSLRETSVSTAGCTEPGLEPGTYLLLSVTDDGPGMDAETVDHIFEPYFTTKEKGKGTGLGLAVVHGIVKSHHGTVSVSSKPGEGTTFDLYFPLHEQPLPEDDAYHDLPAAGSESLLVVDDEPAVADIMSQILTPLGYAVVVKTAAREALEAFQRNPAAFDAVITDKNMPEMNGFTLSEKILALRPDIPVLLCTGYSEKSDEEKAREKGIHEVIMKPLSRHNLAAAIRRAIDR